MAKLYTGELSNRAANASLQIHGGYGFMEESAISRLYRDQKILEIGEGTNEVQRMVIARISACSALVGVLLRVGAASAHVVVTPAYLASAERGVDHVDAPNERDDLTTAFTRDASRTVSRSSTLMPSTAGTIRSRGRLRRGTAWILAPRAPRARVTRSGRARDRRAPAGSATVEAS